MAVKVCKFGGTSLASAENIEKVVDIIKSDSERRYVVVSAPGKRSKQDIKITDMLYECAKAAREKGKCDEIFERIADRFIGIVTELKLDFDIKPILDETKNQINLFKDEDFAASRGEYLNAIILAKKLGFEFVDACDIVKFDSDAKFDAEYTNDLSSKRLSKVKYAVIPGFYGSLPGDKIKTFSRGGSDVSGAIIARAVNAVVYENWTDVNGFFSVDPRIVENPMPIATLTYKELRELSYMGASVLHADSIFPVRNAGIPINIRNTFEPSNSGTLILPENMFEAGSRLITGIAGKKDFTIIFIEKSMMNSELGFARRVLTILERYGVSFEHMPSGIDTLSLVVSSHSLENGLLEKLIIRIREAVEPDSITAIENLAIIATVGHGMTSAKGTSGRLFSAIGKSNINIIMIDQGSSELNIIVGVKNEDYVATVKAIYDEFFGE